jgi:SagB-type dehydrogenase family enzyme
VRYEASVALPPKEYADLKSHQVHYKASNLVLQREARLWPASRKFPLPEPAYEQLGVQWTATPEPISGPSAEMTVDRLSLLLVLTAGLRPDEGERQKVGRWTASGGNIGSVVVYVVVRDCAGLEPGIYGYVITTHQLARLSDHLGEMEGDSPVTIVLTGDYRKVAQKYAAFALRIVLLDSGCAQATARLAANAVSLRMRVRGDWDDTAVAAALGVDSDVEPVTAVLDLGGTA